jgi:hypothetical protein
MPSKKRDTQAASDIGSISTANGITAGTSSTPTPKVFPNPYVIVDFLFESGLLHICIKNTSAVPAFNINVSFNPKLMGVEGTVEVSALALFTDLAFLPGGKEIATLVDTSASFFQSNQATQFTTQITYQDFFNVQFSHTIHHNLEIYRKIGYIAGPVAV